jgi:hypothetical protein
VNPFRLRAAVNWAAPARARSELLDREVFEALRRRGTRDRLGDPGEWIAVTADLEPCLIGLHRNLVAVDDRRRRREGEPNGRCIASTQDAAESED